MSEMPEKWDREQLMGKKDEEGNATPNGGIPANGDLPPMLWGIPGYLTSEQVDVYVSIVVSRGTKRARERVRKCLLSTANQRRVPRILLQDSFPQKVVMASLVYGVSRGEGLVLAIATRMDFCSLTHGKNIALCSPFAGEIQDRGGKTW